MSSFDRLCVDCVVLLRAHQYEEAIPLLREIVSLDPDNPHISSGLVNALAWTNRPHQAIAAFERMQDLQKGGLGQVLNACVAFHLLGEHERELETVRRALGRFPTLSGGIRWNLDGALVNALAALGRSDEARQVIERMFYDSEPASVWLAWQAGAELEAHGWPQEAGQIAEDTLERSPPSETLPPWTRWCLTLLMLQADRPADARALLGELASENPNELYIVGLAGAMAAHVGDDRTTKEMLRRIDEIAGPYSFGEDDYWRACIAAQLGDKEGAMDDLNAALRDGQQFDLTFHRNPFLLPLHGHEPFEEFLRPKG